MPSSSAIFETFFCVFPVCTVNERAAHVKIDRDAVGVDLGHSNSLLSPVVGWLLTSGVL